jgi:hypothetical protein
MKELNIKLTVSELNLILESLGNMPYIRVYELISQIQQQAKEQLNGASSSVGLNHENDSSNIARKRADVEAS